MRSEFPELTPARERTPLPQSGRMRPPGSAAAPAEAAAYELLKSVAQPGPAPLCPAPLRSAPLHFGEHREAPHPWRSAWPALSGRADRQVRDPDPAFGGQDGGAVPGLRPGPGRLPQVHGDQVHPAEGDSKTDPPLEGFATALAHLGGVPLEVGSVVQARQGQKSLSPDTPAMEPAGALSTAHPFTRPEPDPAAGCLGEARRRALRIEPRRFQRAPGTPLRLSSLPLPTEARRS